MYRTPLRIIQINLAKNKCAQEELFTLEKQFDIALVQEPYTIATTGLCRARHPHKVFQKKTSQRIKAAIIVLNPDITGIMLSEYSTSNMAVMKIGNDTDAINIISAYVEPDNAGDQSLATLDQVIGRLMNGKTIIGGDFNGHHAMWGSDACNDRGHELADMFLSRGYHIHNIGRTPTFETQRGGIILSSMVDLTLASVAALDMVASWHVDQGLILTTDHNSITFEIHTTINEPTTVSTAKFKSTLADWDKFDAKLLQFINAKRLHSLVENCSNAEELDGIITKLTHGIQSACHASMPLKKPRKEGKPQWWSTNLDDQKKNVRHLKRRACRTHTMEDIRLFWDARMAYKASINKACVESWTAYCGGEGKDDSWTLINRVLSKPGWQTPATIRKNNEWTHSASQTASVLLESFYPYDDATTDNEENARIRVSAWNTNGTGRNEVPFTIDEVRDAMARMNPKKAPGHDHLTADICQRFASQHQQLLTDIYNQCLRLTHFPTQWKYAQVVCIPKPGKDDYTSPASYRPIGLLDVLGKVLERLIMERLKYSLYTRDKMSKKQFGFTAQTSTADALYELTRQIKDGISHKKQVMLISMDAKSAFDNAWWPMMSSQLRAKNCPLNIFNLLESYMTDREVGMNYAGGIARRTPTKGCVQGSVSGPFLWNLIVDDLLQREMPEGCSIQAFADDITLLVQAKDVKKLKDLTKEATEIILEWGRKTKIEFNASKTIAVSFTKEARECTLQVGGIEVHPSAKVKLLGIIIDERLSFTPHVRYAIEKALSIFKLTCRATSPTWGLSPDLVKRIYLQIVEPTIMYGIEIWHRALRFKYVRRMLLKIQRCFALRAAKAYRTTSLNASLPLAGFVPIDLRLEETAALASLKRGKSVAAIATEDSYQGRVDYYTLPHPSQRRILEYGSVHTDDDAQTEASSADCVIYTDGSKIDGKVGASFIATLASGINHEAKLPLGPACSVFQAELTAILHALRWTQGQMPQVTKIFSDSKSALEAIKDRNNVNPIVCEIRSIVDAITRQQRTVHLYWVKAHIGISGNEAADALAKEAAHDEEQDKVWAAFPLSYAKRILKRDAIEKWNERYLTAGKGLTTVEFLASVETALALRRHVAPTYEMSQILSGHGLFKAYLHRFHLSNDASCPCDGATLQTTQHVTWDCPSTQGQRTAYLNSCEALGIDGYDMNAVAANEVASIAFTKYAYGLVHQIRRLNREHTTPSMP